MTGVQTCALPISISIFDGNVIINSLDAIKKGHPLYICPEGLMNPDKQRLRKSKTGVARIALMSKVPVLPIGVVNSEKVLPIHSFIPRFSRAWLNIGKPIDRKSVV